jgi:acyl carrier protein
MNDRERVREKIAEILGHKPEKIVDDAVLTDLVNNSFLLVETVIELQEEFNIHFQQSDLTNMASVGQLLDLSAARMAALNSGSGPG